MTTRPSQEKSQRVRPVRLFALTIGCDPTMKPLTPPGALSGAQIQDRSVPPNGTLSVGSAPGQTTLE
eukprot:9516170-Alexandrium_andersonii.AAC.1